MNSEEIIREFLDELISSLESLETQTRAIAELVKAKGIASDQEIADALNQAGNAADVKWRAARVRLERLMTTAVKSVEDQLKPNEQPGGTQQPVKKDDLAKNSAGESSDKGKETDTGKEKEKENNARRDGDKGKEKSQTDAGNDRKDPSAANGKQNEKSSGEGSSSSKSDRDLAKDNFPEQKTESSPKSDKSTDASQKSDGKKPQPSDS